MFEVKLKTFYKDGREVETVASAEHFIEFEEHFDEAFGAAFSTGKFTYSYYLSWLTIAPGVEFKEWAKSVRDVDPEIVGLVPFQAGPSEVSSPSSL